MSGDVTNGPREREDALVDDYGMIPDPQERFQVVVETAPGRVAELPERFRTPEHLVSGCQSRVWLGVWRDEDGKRVQVALDSDAPAMKAVGALFVLVYSGSSCDQIHDFETRFLERLGIADCLTPTRRRGVQAIRRRLVEWADELGRG